MNKKKDSSLLNLKKFIWMLSCIERMHAYKFVGYVF